MRLQIASGFYESESLPLSSQRCINWRPVVTESKDALNTRALLDVPGISLFAELDGANRGSHKMSGSAYFINGERLYEVLRSGVSIDRGEIRGGNRVSTADNGRYLVIVSPGYASYVFDNTNNTLETITDRDFRAASTVRFKDGYFLFSASAGDVFFSSRLNEPTRYDALDYAAAEISPDYIVALHINHNELFVLGEETCEIFQNVGGVGFPFQRIDGANIQKGCHAPASVVEFDNTFLFVGGGLNERSAVWRMSGSSSAVKISTAAIDHAIQQFSEQEIKDSFAWTYSQDGNFFAGFTFSGSAGKTFVYDATASALSGEPTWHERQSGERDAEWRVSSVMMAYDKILVGDLQSGKIGVLDADVKTEYGNPIFRQRSSKPFSGDGMPVFAGELALTMESGVGSDIEPIVRLDWSDDGGRTFGSELQRGFGKVGEYESIPIWRRLGRFPRERVIRFTTTAPVTCNILKLEAEIDVGRE